MGKGYEIEDFGVKVGELVIFEGVNMQVQRGEITAIIGPNGGGKSTLMKALIGEVKHSGRIGYEGSGKPVIGYVPQYLTFDVTAPISVIDIFMACKREKPVWLKTTKREREEIERKLRRVQAEHLIERRLGALSGGELQRVLIALALEPKPDLLLLDEPVSGVDRNGLELFYEILEELKRREDMAIIMISHDLEQVLRHADQVILLDKGVLAAGRAAEVLSNEKMKEKFGTII